MPTSMQIGPPDRNPINPVQDFVVSAAVYGQKAWQVDDLSTGERRGLRTASLLEGLQADALTRRPHHGLHAARFCAQACTALAKLQQLEKNLEQEPEVAPPDREMVFGPVVPPDSLPGNPSDKVSVRIIAPARLDGDLIVRNGSGLGEIDSRCCRCHQG